MAFQYSSRRLAAFLLNGRSREEAFSRLLSSSAVPKPVALSKLKDNFNDGTSISYLEEIEQRYREDPKSVDRSWASFFNNMGAPLEPLMVLLMPLLCSACGNVGCVS